MVNAQVVWRLSSLEILVLTTHTDTGIRHSSKTATENEGVKPQVEHLDGGVNVIVLESTGETVCVKFEVGGGARNWQAR